MVVVSYLVGTLLLHRILPYIIRRTSLDLADRFVTAVGPELRWLVVMFALQFATRRLSFVDAGLKDLLADLYFVAGLTIGLHGVWRLIDLLGEWYGQRAMHAGHEEQIAVFITLLKRVARAVLLVIVFTISN